MTPPSIESVYPTAVGAVGGELVRITGFGFTPRVAVTFGGITAEVLAVLEDDSRTAIDVRAPRSEPGHVALAVQNLYGTGAAIPGAAASVGFRFLRALISEESDLTRLVRALLRALKAQVIANASTQVALDYREQASTVIPIAKVPSITLIGPDIRENRLYATNEPGERVVSGPAGLEVQILRPAVAVDLHFVLEVVTNTTAEHLNLVTGITNFVHRNPYLSLERDGADPSAGTVRFPLFADGEARTARTDDTHGRTSDKKSFEWGLVIRGFPIDDHFAMDRTTTTTDAGAGVQVGVLAGKAAP